MDIKYFKENKGISIPSENPKEISLDEAISEIESQVYEEGNFIGFINSKDECIQFIKFEDAWFMLNPIGDYDLMKEVMSEKEVINAVRLLFDGESNISISKQLGAIRRERRVFNGK